MEQPLVPHFCIGNKSRAITDGWEYGPPMVQTLHPLWKKWFKLKKKLMTWKPLEIEKKEIDKEAKKLEEQKYQMLTMRKNSS